MKSMLSLILILCAISARANTAIIKPLDTEQAARGIFIVNGIHFDYSVLDHGWRTFGEIVPQFNVTAEKSFILSYQVQTKLNKSKASTIQNEVQADVEKKCLELGQIEFKDQVSTFDQTYNKDLSATIVSDIKPNFTKTSFAFSAVCLIKVQITK